MVAASRATHPPITASSHRENAWSGCATRIVTMADCTPAWVVVSTPPSRKVVIAMAVKMIRAICQYPLPRTETARSPTMTPTATPVTIWKARWSRCPNESPSPTMAATGAKNGWVWPTMSRAMNQAMAAEIAICARKNDRALRRPHRCSIEVRLRRRAARALRARAP